jgi:FAD binding domain/Berberine and berberine like
MNKNYNKRNFLKAIALGATGLTLYHFYNIEKPLSNEEIKPQIPAKKVSKTIDITPDDVVILTRNDAVYEKFRNGYNKRISLFPQAIAVCKTEKGVQFAVDYATKNKLKIAVRSGGHSFEGFSSNSGGLVINVSQMKKIVWQNDTVNVQPGNMLQEIYNNFLPRKKIVPAGSCGTVGISGLTLGGGYGLFSRNYGLTCDNLIGLKMVGNDAEIYDSNEHPDLLWACKGGGNGNFGVVTELRYKTHDAPENFSSYVLKFRDLDQEKFITLINKWFDLYPKLPLEAFSAFVLNGKTLTILITNFLAHTNTFEEIFSELIKMSDKYKPSKNQNLASALKRYYGRENPLYFKNASAGMFHGAADLSTIYVSIFDKVISNPGIIFQINTLGGNINLPEFEKNSAYPHRNYNFLGELQAYWESPNQEKRLVTAFQEIQEVIKSNGVKAHYRNYPDINFPDWQNSYYGTNYKKLQAIKTKFDPEDLFHYAQGIEIL